MESLIAARALLGVGAALAAPNGPALISTNFPVGAAFLEGSALLLAAAGVVGRAVNTRVVQRSAEVPAL